MKYNRVKNLFVKAAEIIEILQIYLQIAGKDHS